MPNQTPRFYTRRSVIAATHLVGPMRHHRSKRRCCSEGSCSGVAVRRKNELKSSTTIVDIFSGDCAAVCFNDGVDNRQSHAKPFTLSTEKRIKQPVPHILRNPDAMITHTRANCAIPIRLCCNQDF